SPSPYPWTVPRRPLPLMPPHDGQTKRAVLVGVADRVSDLGRPGFVQAAEQLDWPFVVGEIGEYVGKADAVGIDDERHRAATSRPVRRASSRPPSAPARASARTWPGKRR